MGIEMGIEIRDAGVQALAGYADVPIRFRVESVLRVEELDGGLGGLRLREERLAEPYVKDYDACHDELPVRWAKRFDVSSWGFFQAFDAARSGQRCRPDDGERDGRPVGGAVVAFRSPEANALEGRADLAVLWDLRVHPDRRGEGIGAKLFGRAAAWSRERGCRQLKAETQDVNVPACRFYAKHGCRLGRIDRYGYAGDPRVAHEMMLVWYLGL